MDVIRQLYREGGIRSIFRGTGATLLRDGPGSAAYFAAYELTKTALTPKGAKPEDLNMGAVLFAGGKFVFFPSFVRSVVKGWKFCAVPFLFIFNFTD